MNIYKQSKWNRKTFSICLMIIFTAVYSMNVLAAPARISGELTVPGKALGDKTLVNVNGSNVESGRLIFSSSIIRTPKSSEAIINLGKTGRVRLAPSTTLTLIFDENSLHGKLSGGKVYLMSSSDDLNTIFSVEKAGKFKFASNTSAVLLTKPDGLEVNLGAGQITSLNSIGKVFVKKLGNDRLIRLETGETISVARSAARRRAADRTEWLVWATTLGGAVTGTILASISDNNRVLLDDSGTVVVSPNQ